MSGFQYAETLHFFAADSWLAQSLTSRRAGNWTGEGMFPMAVHSGHSWCGSRACGPRPTTCTLVPCTSRRGGSQGDLGPPGFPGPWLRLRENGLTMVVHIYLLCCKVAMASVSMGTVSGSAVGSWMMGSSWMASMGSSMVSGMASASTGLYTV